MRATRFFLFMFFLVFQVSEIHARASSDLVKNTTEQLDFLYNHNKTQIAKGNPDKAWYIYFLGANKIELEHLVDHTESINNDYLIQLNKKLQFVNAHQDVAMYVAFTKFDFPILTPVFPSEENQTLTLNEMESYVNSYFSGWDYYRTEEFTIFTEDFKKSLQQAYDNSKLSDSNKKNHILPFTMLNTREIINKDKQPIFKRIQTYSLFAPKTGANFNQDDLKVLYNNTEAQFGTTSIEKKIERVVTAIEKQLVNGEQSGAPECYAMLKSDLYKHIKEHLPANDSWVQIIEENPCILNNWILGDPVYFDSEQFEQELMMFVCYPLYAAMAIPSASILGPSAIATLAERYGVQKLNDASIAMILNASMQIVTYTYFSGNEEISSLPLSNRLIWAKDNLDYRNVGVDGLKELIAVQTKYKAILGCVLNGIEFTEGEFNDWEDLNQNFDLQKCLADIRSEYFNFLLGRAGGPILKRLKVLATTNPKLFIKGLRQLQEDSPEMPIEVWDGLKQAFKDAGSEFKPAALLMDIETWYSKPLKSYLENGLTQIERNLALPNASSSQSFNNTVKDVAFDIHSQMDLGNSNVLELGANITLAQGSDEIRLPLVCKLKGGGYRMIIVIDNDLSIHGLNDLIDKLPENRQTFLKEIQAGEVTYLKGQNASEYFNETGTAIEIEGIEVYTKNANSSYNKHEFSLKNNGGEHYSNQLKKLALQDLQIIIRDKVTNITEKSIITKTLNSATANQQFTGQMIKRFGMNIDLNKVNPPHADIPNIGINDFKILEKKYFVRVSNSNNDPFGEWLISLEDFNNFKSIDEIKDALAIPNRPTHFSLAEIPEGIIIRESQAAKVWREGNYWGNGGIKQYLIQDFIEMEENIVKQWFSNSESLNNFFK